MVRKTGDHRKSEEQSFEGTNYQYSQQACQRKSRSQYFRWLWRSHCAGFKIPGVGWKYFRETRSQMEIIRSDAASVGKFGRIHGVWRQRCSRPDGYQGIPNFGCRYLVAAKSVGIDCGAEAESCNSGKVLLAQNRHLLWIFGRCLCWFGIFGSLLTSVE